jgi:hypothetical protein
MAADRRDINRLNISKGSRLRRASARESLSGAGNAADIRVTHTDEAGMVLQASTGGGKYYSVPLFDLNNPEPKTPGITRAGETIKITADNVLIPNDLTVQGKIKMGAKSQDDSATFDVGLNIDSNLITGDRSSNSNNIIFGKSMEKFESDSNDLPTYIRYTSGSDSNSDTDRLGFFVGSSTSGGSIPILTLFSTGANTGYIQAREDVKIQSDSNLVLDGGYLEIKETTTPSATTDFGKIYTKNDNKLYFQDGAGTEHEISYSNHSH